MYVLIPRSLRIKLVPKWYEPFKVDKQIYPAHGIELFSKNGNKLIKNMSREKIVAEHTTRKNMSMKKKMITLKLLKAKTIM